MTLLIRETQLSRMSPIPHFLVLARVAVRDHDYKGVEVAEALSLSSSTVSRIVKCGENIPYNQKDIGVKHGMYGKMKQRPRLDGDNNGTYQDR